MNEYINLIKQADFNILEIYKQAPNESLLVLALLIAIAVTIVFFINNSIKRATLIKEIENIEQQNEFEQFVSKLNLFIKELPKRGQLGANSIDKYKEKILYKTLKLLTDFEIKEKIKNYQLISKKFEELSKSCHKYNDAKISTYFSDKSHDMINIYLNKELQNYFETVRFNENDVENINAIVQYANEQESKFEILDKLFANINKYSFSYNIELFKFIEKLEEEKSKQLFEYCKEKIEKIFTSKKDDISLNILTYLYENDKKEKVYEYIKQLTNSSYLQHLYYQLFNKKDDLDLDLAFIANPTKIENEYKEYIDISLTTNWRDEQHIEYVSKAPGVLEVLGHVEFRSLIERVDRIKIDERNDKRIEEALMIAKRAESIAIEAKSFNQKNSNQKN